MKRGQSPALISVLFLFISCSFFNTLQASTNAAAASPQGSANVVKVTSGESTYKVKRGAAIQIALSINVEEGYHINSNRPNEKYLIPTSLKFDRIPGITTSPIVYPKAKLQKFEFSEKPLSVFEGKTVLKTTVRVLPSLSTGAQTLKGKLMVQACNNQQCLRPQSVDVNVALQVE